MGRPTFTQTIGALYQASLDASRWTTALERVAEHAGGSGALLVCNDLVGGASFMTVGHLRTDLTDLYLERHLHNPVNQAIARHGRPGIPRLATSFVGREALRSSELQAEILDPQRIVDMLAVPHLSLSTPGCTGGVAIALHARAADDAEATIARTARLTPHLLQAVDLTIELARLRSTSRNLDALLDMLPSAALLLDATARTLRTNREADTILAGHDGILRTRDGTLAATLPDARPTFAAAIRTALAATDPDGTGRFRQSIAIPRPSGDPALLVVLTPLPPALDDHWIMAWGLGGHPRLLVQIIDPVAQIAARAPVLQQAYGLTEAEARIATLIAAGLSTPHVARRLGLAPSTVRTHLARTFEKTGVRTQVTLARLIGAILA